VVGALARVDDVYICQCASMADDVVIVGAENEHSHVLGGADVRSRSVRLTMSTVGLWAPLVRGFPRAIRAAVGADVVVALS
jgi:hypothetical protein